VTPPASGRGRPDSWTRSVYDCKLPLVGLDVDWQHGADHMHAHHQITVQQADETLADPLALLFGPDPKSTSGKSARLRLLARLWPQSSWSFSSGVRTGQDHGGALTAGGQTARTAGPMRKGSQRHE
jgi:hypothetical protein